MRDPGRIQPLLNALGEVWAKHPDQRLGQLLLNATQRPAMGLGSLFYIEDDDLLAALRVLDEGE